MWNYENICGFSFFSPVALRRSPGKLWLTMRCGLMWGHSLHMALSKSCRDDFQRHFMYIYMNQTILRKFWDESNRKKSKKKRATTESDSGEWRPQISSFHSKTLLSRLSIQQPRKLRRLLDALWLVLYLWPITVRSALGNLTWELPSASCMHSVCFSFIPILSACTSWQ